MRIALALGACFLAACAATPPERPTPAPVTSAPAAPAHRAGDGVIESASVVALPSSSAAGGATGPTMAYGVRMADGSTQSIVQAGERLQLGDSVQVTADGRLVRR